MDPIPSFPDLQPAIAQIGDINVTSVTISTPSGIAGLRGSQWTVTDQWTSYQRTPRWAIVAAVVGFCVIPFVCLLFLLVKETAYQGFVTVTVINGAFAYTTRIAVSTQDQVQRIYDQVNYVRQLALL
jgi:hypothetical protein